MKRILTYRKLLEERAISTPRRGEAAFAGGAKMFSKAIAKTLVVALLISTIPLFSGCGSSAAEEEVVTSVEIGTAITGNLSLSQVVTGTVKAANEVQIIPKVAGKVEEVHKKVGDTVAVDDILFVVDRTNINNQLMSAQAQVDSASVNLMRAEGSGSQTQLIQAEGARAQAQNGLTQAQIAYENALTDYNLNVELANAGAISAYNLNLVKSKLDSAEASLSSARVALANAERNYELISSTINSEGVRAARAQLTSAQAALRTVQQQAADSVVRSTINGVVSAVNIDVGQMAAMTSPAVTVVDISSVTVEIEVSEKYINHIVQGDIASVKIRSLDDAVFTGTIDTISPAASSQRAMYVAKITIENLSGIIKPGMTGTVEFNRGVIEDVLLVPMAAVIKESGKNVVYLCNEGIAAKKEVEVGENDGVSVQILSGINDGDVVITKGQQFLSDGQKVTITEGDGV